MKKQRSLKVVLYCSLLIAVVLSAQVWGAAMRRPGGGRRRGLYGDWKVKVDYNGRQFESILSFSRDKEGSQTGQWISLWGINELKEVKFEEGKLSFIQERRNRQGETTTSKFSGTIKEGKLSGTLSSDRGESKLEGTRSPGVPRVSGNWEMKLKMGEREFTGTLIIKADKEGKLTGEWKSQRGEHTISDLAYQRRKLTFKRKSKMGEREWESTFEGNIEGGNTLKGVFKSERGEITAEGKLAGAALIGTWNLDIASQRGDRKQRLRVNPDMSGLYGAVPLEKVNLEGDKVSFKAVMKFREREFEMSFEGKLAEAKLTGELTTSRGSRKVTGTKVVRRLRRRG